ncbi:MAG: hypothetical protein FJY38_07635 [Betaproteobacteria bacterium]|nr:hypothetical protein [Betaproteobacteria bacterium]
MSTIDNNLPSPLAYIPSSGQGEDKGVHHRLPDGRPVTYADIMRAVQEGRGDEDVSPFFTGQTNAQALGAYRVANIVNDPPFFLSAAVALAQRSIFGLTSAIASSLTASRPPVEVTDPLKSSLAAVDLNPPKNAEPIFREHVAHRESDPQSGE